MGRQKEIINVEAEINEAKAITIESIDQGKLSFSE